MRIKVKTDRQALPMWLCGRVALSPSNYIFALTNMSLRDFPLFLKEMIGGFVKLVYSKGLLCIRLQYSINICFKFLNDRVVRCDKSINVRDLLAFVYV